MGTLTIGGKAVTVDDSFRNLSPADQQKTVDEISAHMGGGQPAQAPAPAGPSFWKSAGDLAYSMTPAGMAQGVGQAVMHPSQALQSADDRVRGLANGMTFGFADKAAAGMNNALGNDANYTTALSKQRGYDDAARTRDPAGYMAAEVAGSMLPTSRLAAAGVTATKLPALVSMIAGTGKKANIVAKSAGLLGSPIDGAVLGGVSAAGNDQNIGQGALTGGLLGTGMKIGEAAIGGLMSNSANAAMRNNAPTFEQNSAAKNAAYKKLQDAGIKFDADGYGQTLQNISKDLGNFRAAKAPLTADTLDNLKSFNGQSPNFVDMEGMLQDAKGILREPNASNTDKKAAGIVLDHLNEFFNNGALISNGSVAAGDVPALAATARDLARRDILSKQLAKMGDKSEWYVSGPESGMRNQVAAFGKRAGKGLTDAEFAAAQAVVKREGLGNVINQAGTRLAMHGGTGAAGIIGTMLGGPLGGIAAAGTGLLGNLAARSISNSATNRAVAKLGQTILAGPASQRAAAATIESNKKIAQQLFRMGLLGGTPALLGYQNGQ